MTIITETLPRARLQAMAAGPFDGMVKAVVDVDRGLLAVDAELHADLEALLLADGSRPGGLWGINLYPGAPADQWVEYDSMITMRPSQGNKSRGVEHAAIRQQIMAVVAARLPP